MILMIIINDKKFHNYNLDDDCGDDDGDDENVQSNDMRTFVKLRLIPKSNNSI